MVYYPQKLVLAPMPTPEKRSKSRPAVSGSKRSVSPSFSPHWAYGSSGSRKCGGRKKSRSI